ncbi:hypothetical protein PBY51_018236 [Eleginops maclovinus]|uniref:Uncharacterized protein n=1 Tax=Eleginops maclovinus TaxID=56733 RepID=A0AAN7XLB1_ELEMC|nr:hypothetical protein PBY51_018236 [Eleginops maclovinus]
MRRGCGSLQQYREDKQREREREQDTAESCFFMVLADMLTTVDPAYQWEARHKLYQQVFEYTVQHPRLD